MDKKYEIVLHGGHVIDPTNNIDGIMDVAIKDGNIAAVSKNIPGELAERYIDVSGNYVTPGLIDIHAHVYPQFPKDEHALAAVACDVHLLKAGVTTTADAGTVGWRDFLSFKDNVIDKSKVRVFSYINIADRGMIDMRSEQTYTDMHPAIVAEVAKQYSDVVVGVKAAHYWGGPKPFDDMHPAWASVDNAIKAAGLCGMPAMIDFQPNLPLSSYADLVSKKLRPGDIHTHVFAQQFPTVDDDGKVYDYMFKARERGVYFDVGHGAGSFWFRNSQRALRDGFPPDTLSTDLHVGSVAGPVLSMLHLMGKFLNMGMPLNEVVMRSTSEPAKLINHPELGTLSVGGCADVAVIRKIDGDFGYIDNGRAKINGTSMLNCQMTIRGGEIVFDGYGLGMPKWEDAPYAYWNPPYRG